MGRGADYGTECGQRVQVHLHGAREAEHLPADRHLLPHPSHRELLRIHNHKTLCDREHHLRDDSAQHLPDKAQRQVEHDDLRSLCAAVLWRFAKGRQAVDDPRNR